MRYLIFIVLIFVKSSTLNAQQGVIVTEFNTNGTFTWVCPSNIDTILVECWGAGGGGGGTSLYLCAKGTVGGGGGAYSITKVAVTPGDIYTINVGKGGLGGSPGYFGYNGSGTNFSYQSQILASASGGAGGAGIMYGNCWISTPNGGIGGQGGTGLLFIGGSGGLGNSNVGGGGGASGAFNANGSNGTNNLGGVSGSGGGKGGDGGINCNFPCYMQGQNGLFPGGGGGGTYASTQNGSGSPINALGGQGADGQLIISLKKNLRGQIFEDMNIDCTREQYEQGLKGVKAYIMPVNIVTEADSYGQIFLDSLDPGSYTIEYSTPNNWGTVCNNLSNFSVINSDSILILEDFGIFNNQVCSDPEISIYAPFLRRCFNNQKIYGQVCNKISATDTLINSYVELILDPLMIVTGGSLPYTSQGGNSYFIETGNINPGQCVDFNISTTISCSAMNGQTLCMDANLYPVESCVLDTIPSDQVSGGGSFTLGGTLDGLPQPCTLPWDQSSLSVDGWCQNDTIYFTITNTGELGGGDMECYSPVWVMVDGVMTFTDSILIQGGQTITYTFPGDGQTWILNAEQHPLHPGNSHPNAHVEACGDTTNWTSDLVNDFPLDDADPVVDIYCGVVTGSYDPNDKKGYPTGQTVQHYIQPNQQLQYVIRFQNTGTDTAFTVVIRDTLDTDLNIFSVSPGVSSHNYEFRMYGPRVLEWTFNNINLPDSTTDLEGSNGFVTFHVDQEPDLAPGTEITNDADIYFDFNDPITTNTTIHRIFEGFVSVASLEGMVKNHSTLTVYPNPTSGSITITSSEEWNNEKYEVYDQSGRKLLSGILSDAQSTIQLPFGSGLYFLKIRDEVVKVQVVK